MSAATLVRTARLRAGLDQSALAARAGTSQPNVSLIERGIRVPTTDTFARLLASAGCRLIAVRTPYDDAVAAADRIQSALRSGEREVALRALIDYSNGLSASSDVDRVVLAAAEPASTGSLLWDASLAAIAEYWLDDHRLPKPPWLHAGRRLTDPEAFLLSEYDLPPDEADVPKQFRERNVLAPRSLLESV